jgi:CheY-like chemotaxis protein
MGGDVAVTSRVGAGSCFTLDLPLVPASAPVATGARGGLLIVERNPITRAMFRALFTSHGPVTFSDADDALATIARVAPDVVLVDAATFGRGPAELAALVATAHDAPVAMLTEALGERERQEIYAAGLTKVIEKPVSKKGLVDAIGVMPRRSVKDAA